MAGLLAQGRAEREKQAQARAEAKLRDARSAVETLKQRNSAAADEARDRRKAAAKQKIDQIKARIRMMQMNGAADPKVLAQLARELKAAVRMYGGSGGGVTAGAGPDASAQATGEGAAPSDVPGVENAQADSPVSTEETFASTAPETSDAPTDGEAKTAEAETNSASETGRDNPYRRMADEAQSRLAEQSRRSAGEQADRDFLSDVRNLARQIKAMVARAEAQAASHPDQAADVRETGRAAAEAEQAVESVGRELGAAGLSLRV